MVAVLGVSKGGASSVSCVEEAVMVVVSSAGCRLRDGVTAGRWAVTGTVVDLVRVVTVAGTVAVARMDLEAP